MNTEGFWVLDVGDEGGPEVRCVILNVVGRIKP